LAAILLGRVMGRRDSAVEAKRMSAGQDRADLARLDTTL
jgi:hypothetical protein